MIRDRIIKGQGTWTISGDVGGKGPELAWEPRLRYAHVQPVFYFMNLL